MDCRPAASITSRRSMQSSIGALQSSWSMLGNVFVVNCTEFSHDSPHLGVVRSQSSNLTHAEGANRDVFSVPRGWGPRVGTCPREDGRSSHTVTPFSPTAVSLPPWIRPSTSFLLSSFLLPSRKVSAARCARRPRLSVLYCSIGQALYLIQAPSAAVFSRITT